MPKLKRKETTADRIRAVIGTGPTSDHTCAEVAKMLDCTCAHVHMTAKHAGVKLADGQKRRVCKTPVYTVRISVENAEWFKNQLRAHKIGAASMVNSLITDARVEEEELAL